jgi:hypothetical protein
MDASRGLRSGVGENAGTSVSSPALWVARGGGVKSRDRNTDQEERTSCVWVTTPHSFPVSAFTIVCHTIVVLPR